MKKIILLIAILNFLYANPPKPAPFVSPERFSGLWYEIARTYNDEQKTCVASSVEYKFIPPMYYEVFNRCFDGAIGADLIEYNGYATPLESGNMNKIKMTYYWIFSKIYNVYFVDETYYSALVADERFEHVWIMSREPKLGREKLDKIINLLTDVIDINKLIYTPQDSQGRYK